MVKTHRYSMCSLARYKIFPSPQKVSLCPFPANSPPLHQPEVTGRDGENLNLNFSHCRLVLFLLELEKNGIRAPTPFCPASWTQHCFCNSSTLWCLSGVCSFSGLSSIPFMTIPQCAESFVSGWVSWQLPGFGYYE